MKHFIKGVRTGFSCTFSSKSFTDNLVRENIRHNPQYYIGVDYRKHVFFNNKIFQQFKKSLGLEFLRIRSVDHITVKGILSSYILITIQSFRSSNYLTQTICFHRNLLILKPFSFKFKLKCKVRTIISY